jgi:hypothetical protein
MHPTGNLIEIVSKPGQLREEERIEMWPVFVTGRSGTPL